MGATPRGAADAFGRWQMTAEPGSRERAHLVKKGRKMMTNRPAAKDLGRHAMDQGSSAADGFETVAAALRERVDGFRVGNA